MSVTVSATLAVNEALAEKRRRGLPVLPLGFGEAGLPVHPAMREALVSGGDRNAYGPVAGAAELRDAAAGYWQRRGLPTDPDLVVAGPGSKPLLYSLLLAIGGDTAAAAPSWVSYAAQAQLAGYRCMQIPTAPAQGGVPQPDLLAAAVGQARAQGRDVRSVIVTAPDNPTGTLASAATVRRLAETARDLDLVVISDEIYRDLVHEQGAEVHSPAEYAPERTVVSTGLSKNLALGGWRLGVTRLPDSALGRSLRAALLGVASEIWSSPAGPIQQAAAYAFTEPAELTERVRGSARLHGIVARAAADRFAAAGAMVAAPQAAFYSYPDLEAWRGHLAREHGITTGAGLTALLLEEYGMGVLPGSEFGDSTAALRMRVATSLLYGDTDEQRRAALAADDPLALPWIAEHLDRLSEVLDRVGPAQALDGPGEPAARARD
ncbi:pyridoxal phosphate-dependent aminotransferase [Streptomonospora sp. PA3]|uniref:pyridoxal phosphate-dependent aminotransferase n=1 Tax=Streptomonospora sp. PA3 TaxID=2607326 RepID=UPI0012DC7B43|nr:pyridoxal phosphate-dependent aminotransferase [Streptomonospora sp. PA3]MUL42503.1 pyridoxal phosphate-dependent aminotransferase [Streptomonospora sp. PA3]